MKKTIIASSLAIFLLSGCISTGFGEKSSYVELQKEGQEMMLSSNAGGYSASGVQDLEKVRLVINSTFLVAQPIYERYTETLINTPAIGNYLAATEAVDSKEDKEAIYTALTPSDKKTVDNYLKSSVTKEAMSGMSDVLSVLLENQSTFLTASSGNALLQVDWSDIMAEKDRISHTADQIAYLNSTVVSAYQNYQVVSAFSSAK